MAENKQVGPGQIRLATAAGRDVELKFVVPEIVVDGIILSGEALQEDAYRAVWDALHAVVPAAAEAAVAALLQKDGRQEIANEVALDVFGWLNPNDEHDANCEAIHSLAQRAAEVVAEAIAEPQAVAN